MPTYTIQVNGQQEQIDSWDPEQPLLYVLRNKLKLTGTRFGCGLSQCGACTVLVDGKVVRSCVTTIQKVSGHSVTTVESLGTADRPSVVQAAFIAEQAAQCGFCSSGMIMAATALLRSNPKPSVDEVKAALAPNLCRCGTHVRIVAAVMRAARAMAAGEKTA